MRQHAIGDPRNAAAYLEALVEGARRPLPLDPGLSYIANLLRQHVAHRAHDVEVHDAASPARLAPAWRGVRERLGHSAALAARVEDVVGMLVIGDDAAADSRELTRMLTLLREELHNLRQLEIAVFMSQHLDDLGGSE